jgi:hypothetical protein
MPVHVVSEPAGSPTPRRTDVVTCTNLSDCLFSTELRELPAVNRNGAKLPYEVLPAVMRPVRGFACLIA